MSGSGIPPAQTKLPPFRASDLSGRLSNHQYSIFQKTTMQVYPLKADMAALRRFIDSYLNFVDDLERPPFYFQPALPYVNLQLLHYPRLSVPTGNLTSFMQHELTFSILLECYKVEDRKLVFKQFAVCTPFIYLDQGVSIVGGRSLFGWPKAALNFDDVHPPDVPTEDAQQVNLQLRVPSITGDKYVPFIEAYRAPRPFASMRRAPADSLTSFSDTLSAYYSSAAEEWYSMLRLPIGGYERARDIESMQAMAQSMGEQFSAFLPMFPLYRLASESYTSTADVLLGPSYMDIITIKQIRDAERPEHAAFQSVVRSTMYLDRFYDFGLLFNPMSADPTTDIKILIHSRPDQQIVESLGLEVSHQNEPGNKGITILKPRFPYWINTDMAYGLGTNLYWRGINTPWSSGELPKPAPDDPSNGKFGSRYCTFGSGAMQENPLAVVSPKGLVYVATLPLEDNGEEKLSHLVKEMLDNTQYDFDLYKPSEAHRVYVWLMVRHINDSGVGLPPAQEQEIVLGVFVEWREKGSDQWSEGARLGIGFMPLFAITDSESRTLTHSEVYGRPIVLGTFEYLGAKWPWPSVGAHNEFDVVAAKTSILPVLYSGAAPEERELIRIIAKLPEKADSAEDHQASSHGESVPYPGSLVIVSLVQVIDCRLPANDSYQAIVMQAMRVPSTTFTLGKIRGGSKYDLYVKFTRYESVPLVQTLGLKTLPPDFGADATIEIVKATNHGWFNSAVEENGSIDFAWQLGGSGWQYPGPPENWLQKLKKIDPHIETEMTRLPEFIAQFYPPPPPSPPPTTTTPPEPATPLKGGSRQKRRAGKPQPAN